MKKQKLSNPSKTKILNETVAAALDRAQLSNSKSLLVLGATAYTLGQDSNVMSLSKETVRRGRIAAREKIENVL